MKISAHIEGKVVSKLTPQQTRPYLERGLVDSTTYLMQKSIENTPKAIGSTAQSIRREIMTQRLQSSIFPTVKHAYYLHGPADGSADRTRPHWIPAREAKEGGSLYRWGKKRGVNPWAVRASIAKRGTKFQPWLKDTAEKEVDRVTQIMDQALDGIAKFLSD